MSSVHVSNIAPITTKKTLEDFFSFCGRITEIDHNADSKTATVHFEKDVAAKTALMLNGGTLDGSSLSVTSATGTSTSAAAYNAEPVAGSSGETHAYEGIHQEDKPRSGIAAEYLAKGYELGDPILQKAIEMDQQHGISTRFINWIKGLDTTIGSKVKGPETTLSEKAVNTGRSLEERTHVVQRANTYYEKALTHPYGQKVYAFWTTTTKQVLDIHEEALRIKETHQAAGTSAAPNQSTAPPAAVPGASIPVVPAGGY